MSERKHRTVRPRRITHLVLMLGGLLMVFPFLWQLSMSLSTQAEVTSVPPTWLPSEPQWGNYPAVFEQVPFLNQFLTTVAVTVARVVGQLLLCALAGYAFARMTFPGKNLLFALVLSILMVPYQIYLIPQYDIIQELGWLNTVAGIAAPGIFSAFGTFLMRQHYMGMPRSLEEAARLDGASPWRTFWQIMFPLSGPALSAVAILTALASWNDLMWPLIVATYDDRTTLAVGLSTLQGQFTTDYPVMMAASFMAMLPLMILFIVLQRHVIAGLAHSGMKG
jgi:multiple sugar transport system permease protein